MIVVEFNDLEIVVVGSRSRPSNHVYLFLLEILADRYNMVEGNEQKDELKAENKLADFDCRSGLVKGKPLKRIGSNGVGAALAAICRGSI
jgi:hypothetical protein